MIYCTRQDRINEISALDALCQKLSTDHPEHQWRYKHCPLTSGFDGELYADLHRAAIVEVKGRTGNGSRYAEWHISKAKIDKLCEIAIQNALDFILVFTWSGKESYACFPLRVRAEWRTASGGRWDRNDPNDQEQMYYIPSSHFEKL